MKISSVFSTPFLSITGDFDEAVLFEAVSQEPPLERCTHGGSRATGSDTAYTDCRNSGTVLATTATIPTTARTALALSGLPTT